MSDPAVIQVKGGQSNSDTGAVSFTSLPTIGNAVIVSLGSVGGSYSQVTDNQGNTYFPIVLVSDSGGGSFHACAGLFWCPKIAFSSGTFTVTVQTGQPGSGAWMAIGLTEASGLLGVVDQLGVGHDLAGADKGLLVTCPAPNAVAVELVIATIGTTSQATDFTTAPNPGYTLIIADSGGSQGPSSTQGYKITSAVETSQAFATWSNAVWSAGAVATFRGAGVASVPTPPPFPKRCRQGGLTMGLNIREWF